MIAITVREMLTIDSLAVAAIMPDLGYEATAVQVEERLLLLRNRPDNAIFIAEFQNEIIGWSHVYGVRLLESCGYAEIGGLVVRPNFQRMGAGTKLIRSSEQWAASHDYTRVRLRSGTHREAAHLFYEALGYKRANSSYAFELHFPV